MTQRDNSNQDDTEVNFDTESQTYTSKFTGEYDKPPSISVVEAVLEAVEKDLKDLRPLYEVIDPDALDQLFESPRQSRGGYIMFEFEGCNVTVNGDGSIAVSPQTNDGE